MDQPLQKSGSNVNGFILLREQAEKEDAEFVLAMEYACQMTHLKENLDNGKRNSNS